MQETRFTSKFVAIHWVQFFSCTCGRRSAIRPKAFGDPNVSLFAGYCFTASLQYQQSVIKTGRRVWSTAWDYGEESRDGHRLQFGH